MAAITVKTFKTWVAALKFMDKGNKKSRKFHFAVESHYSGYKVVKWPK